MFPQDDSAPVQATILHVQALLVPLHFIRKETSGYETKTVSQQWTASEPELLQNQSLALSLFSACRIQQISSLGEEVIINSSSEFAAAKGREFLNFYGPCGFYLLHLLYPVGFPGGSDDKESELRETWGQSLGWEDPMEKEMATHSSILAWRIIGTEDPGRLQSMVSQKARHN